MGIQKEIYIISSSNKQIYGNSWISEKAIKGNVVIAHGMAEYSMRYANFANFLNEQGYNVFMLDHIGHGKNQYLGRGVWPKNGFEECVKNIKILIDELSKEKIPLYLIGHSMGSFMVQYYLETYDTASINKVVLIGTSGPQGLYKIGHLIAKLYAIGKNGYKPSKFLNNVTFSSYNKRIKEKKTSFDWLSTDSQIVKEYIDDPDCGFIPSINFFVSFIGSLSKLHNKENLAKINKNNKILLIAGKEDPVGNYTKSIIKLQKIYNYLGINSKTIFYENMRHEILNEINKEKVFEDIVNFMEI